MHGLAEEYKACATDTYGSWDGGAVGSATDYGEDGGEEDEDLRAPSRGLPAGAGAGSA